ncbi:MAG: hypothetical protein AAFY57_17700 [Cyanobacteria bacterium J06642_2]
MLPRRFQVEYLTINQFVAIVVAIASQKLLNSQGFRLGKVRDRISRSLPQPQFLSPSSLQSSEL